MRCGQMGGKMLYFGRSTVNICVRGGLKALGVRLLDVPDDDQKGVPALNVTHAPMLGVACGQIKPQKAQYGADGEARHTEHRRGEGGRMSLASANALKHAKRLKIKMAGNETETQKGTDPWQRVKIEGGRFAKVGVI